VEAINHTWEDSIFTIFLQLQSSVPAFTAYCRASMDWTFKLCYGHCTEIKYFSGGRARENKTRYKYKYSTEKFKNKTCIVFWDVLPCKMMVDNHFTQQYIPEDNSEHHTRCRENLKSHMYRKVQK
jgi:hypothetical protein